MGNDIAPLYAFFISAHPNDRASYTAGKTEFILRIMARAKQNA
jgi:hypothetical protein